LRYPENGVQDIAFLPVEFPTGVADLAARLANVDRDALALKTNNIFKQSNMFFLSLNHLNLGYFFKGGAKGVVTRVWGKVRKKESSSTLVVPTFKTWNFPEMSSHQANGYICWFKTF
jgi:hypothetical protein